MLAQLDDRVAQVVDVGRGAEEDLVRQPDHLFARRLLATGQRTWL